MRETRANGCGALPTCRACPAARCLARARPGEEHATDGGGVSNASAIGVRGLCDRGACRVRRPPACASSSSRGTGRATACPCRPLVATQRGLGRSCPAAFGRTKNISRARLVHRARDAARAPRARRAVRQTCVFEAPAPQDWRPHRPERRAQAASERRLGHGAAWRRLRGGIGRREGAHRLTVARLGAASRAITRWWEERSVGATKGEFRGTKLSDLLKVR